MARTKKHVLQNHGSHSMDDANSDPEDGASDVEEDKREAERGRTVLAIVGKAIQNDGKVVLEWDPIYKIPRGDNRTLFSSYIGVIARERVNITYRRWTNVPKVTKDEVFDFIAVSTKISFILVLNFCTSACLYELLTRMKYAERIHSTTNS